MEPKIYQGATNQSVAFPLGGMGAGMFALEGNGAYSHFSLYHRPAIWNEPAVFAAVSWAGRSGRQAVMLEGDLPDWKIHNQRGGGNAYGGKYYGLPRFSQCSFSARFPFGTVQLSDDGLPISAQVTGWSPFIPNDEDNSGLPAAAVEYILHNRTNRQLDAVFSFHTAAFLGPDANAEGRRRVTGENGRLLVEFQPKEDERDRGWFCVETGALGSTTNPAWMRGHNFHATMSNWKHVLHGNLANVRPYPEDDTVQSPGGSIFSPVVLPAGGSATVALRFCWYVPNSTLREDEPVLMREEGWRQEYPETYRPWYAARFASIHAVREYWTQQYTPLRAQTMQFTDALYASTLDEDVMDAVASNLCILKTPTVLRQHDGRLWLYEGCGDELGSCYGSCTHVWNYAQAIAHLFPAMERSLRETEFFVAQEEDGYQGFRTPLPIRPITRRTHAAADGQLGGVLKVFREYHICGDRAWLEKLWPRVEQSLCYCIHAWDPNESGRLEYPHHTTYDITIWGLDSLAQSMYVAALQAAYEMAGVLGQDASRYTQLHEKAKQCYEDELFNGEYFCQKVLFQELGVEYTAYNNEFLDAGHPEMDALMEQEGPPYQYGQGCLSDGAIGDWLARCCGLDTGLDAKKVNRHLESVARYNFRESLRRHANPMRAGYALEDEGGLLVCSWPHGGKPTLPLLYSDEVWTGIEYQVAAHLAMTGHTGQALRLVKATRSRYSGSRRNPFNEYECGHFYGRALASYSLLQAFGGVRYSAASRILTIHPNIPGDYSVFLCTAQGYGLAGVKDGKPFFTPYGEQSPKIGTIDYLPNGFLPHVG